MKIQYASDLHLEFRENTVFLTAHPLEVSGDILVLAGDIHVFRGRAWERHPFFDWCAEHYLQTYIIPCNHEYYDGVELCERFDDYEYFIRENVRYINNRSTVMNGVELFFTTLWSIIQPVEIVTVQMGLTDCRRIKDVALQRTTMRHCTGRAFHGLAMHYNNQKPPRRLLLPIISRRSVFPIHALSTVTSILPLRWILIILSNKAESIIGYTGIRITTEVAEQG